ncbi:MAG: aldo/keto reductase [Gammaproteobacteria bacterium]
MIDMVKQLDELVKTGKLRAWGVLNWDITRIEEAHRAAMAGGCRHVPRS